MFADHPAPVFIVGPSRSGTALVRSLVNRHPDVHIANETHYFDDLRRTVAAAEVLSVEDRQVAVDYFRALTHRPYGHFGEKDVDEIGAEQSRTADLDKRRELVQLVDRITSYKGASGFLYHPVDTLVDSTAINFPAESRIVGLVDMDRITFN